jgi:prepilin-type processing-associated H-X9-DG protein
MTSRLSHRNLQALTLVEVMVTVGIVAILASLLIPVGKSAVESSRATRCQGNLRAIGAALQAFAADNNGQIPMRRDNRRSPSTWAEILAVDQFLPASLSGVSPARYCPSEIPVSPHDSRALKGPTNSIYSYGMRRWAPPGMSLMDGEADSRLYHLASIQQPSKFFLVTDSYFTQDKTQGYFVDGFGGNTFWRVHLRHKNRANTLFADGHVEALDRAYFENLHTEQFDYGTRVPFPIWPEQ